MAQREVVLSDLLTAVGAALGTANDRLAGAGSPAMLANYTLSLALTSTFRLRDEALVFTAVAQPSLRQLSTALTNSPVANTTVTVGVVAAPAIHPGAGA